jgi:hypothetical protein
VRLSDFLLARIAEDTERARYGQAHPGSGLAVNPVECEAKRRIVDELVTFHAALGQRMESTDPRVVAYVSFERVARYLALPYANHPDYQDEWRL